MYKRSALLLGLILLLSACASVPVPCRTIESSGRNAVERSWLLEPIEPASLRPDGAPLVNLLNQYTEGDEIWSFVRPGSQYNPTPPYSNASGPTSAGGSAHVPATAASRHPELYRGYVLLRDCRAVVVTPGGSM